MTVHYFSWWIVGNFECRTLDTRTSLKTGIINVVHLKVSKQLWWQFLFSLIMYAVYLHMEHFNPDIITDVSRLIVPQMSPSVHLMENPHKRPLSVCTNPILQSKSLTKARDDSLICLSGFKESYSSAALIHFWHQLEGSSLRRKRVFKHVQDTVSKCLNRFEFQMLGWQKSVEQ